MVDYVLSRNQSLSPELLELVFANNAYLHHKMYSHRLALNCLNKITSSLETLTKTRNSLKPSRSSPIPSNLPIKLKLLKYYLQTSYLASEISDQLLESQSLDRFLACLRSVADSLLDLEREVKQRNSELLLKIVGGLRDLGD